MNNFGYKIRLLTRNNKIILLTIFVTIALVLSLAIPSLARYKNRTSITDTIEWDGTTEAINYKSGTGTESNPYIISNGAELLHLSNSLTSNNYENKYFKLSNSIMLNKGTFSYDETNGVTYTLDNVIYYVDTNTNNYYATLAKDGEVVGTIKMLPSLNGFKGTFDGDLNTIYGFYLNDTINDNVALFTNLNGNVKNLYLENTFIKGGYVTGGLVSNASNTNINNVLVSGYVIGNNGTKESTSNISIGNQNITLTTTLTDNSININTPVISGNIISATLTGNCTVGDSSSIVKINNEEICHGDFSIDLNNSLLNSITAEGITSIDSDMATLTNLSYNVTYNTSITSGIIGIADNTIISNVINKANVIGNDMSSGLVGLLSKNSTISNSYNTTSITSNNYASGLIGYIRQNSNDIVINNCYTSGIVTSTYSSEIVNTLENNGNIILNNIFYTTNDSAIYSNNSSNISFTNSYYKDGTITSNGELNYTSTNDFTDKDFMINTLLYNEFIDSNDLTENLSNMWIYEDNKLPILYIDDITNPIANIYASAYSWNNYSDDLVIKDIKTNLVFSIQGVDDSRPLSKIYYYLSSTALSKDDFENVEWIEYSSPVTKVDDGYYIIYAKVVEQGNGNTYYLNSDIIKKDIIGPQISINLNDTDWTDLRSELNYKYISQPTDISVSANDSLSIVSTLEYYVSNVVINQSDLTSINDWTTYESNITISNNENNIVYVKATDDNNNVTYANSDIIKIGGYSITSVGLGSNNISLSNNSYINDKSIINYNFSYVDSNTYDEGLTHNIITNTLLPIGTKMTWIDKTTGYIYEYIFNTVYNPNNCETDTCVTAIPLTLFHQVGMTNDNSLFNESIYDDSISINENIVLVVDFSNTNISDNYDNMTLYMELRNSSDEVVIPTVLSTIQNINLYSTVDEESTESNVTITTINTNSIVLNSDSTNNYDISSTLNTKLYNENTIFDSQYENKKMGIFIKMLDSNDNIVSRTNYKNVLFKIDDTNYYPESDNITRIKLSDTVENNISTLSIITSVDNINLPTGNYKFVISGYNSYDNLYYDENTANEIEIPVIVQNNKISNDYTFDVYMDNNNRIVNSSDVVTTMDFNIIESGAFINPNIKVSLYKKNRVESTNQSYTLVDLGSYVSNSLELSGTNLYMVTDSPLTYVGTSSTYNNFELMFNNTNFDHTGYKLVFDLYDGETKVGSIDKTFVVK